MSAAITVPLAFRPYLGVRPLPSHFRFNRNPCPLVATSTLTCSSLLDNHRPLQMLIAVNRAASIPLAPSNPGRLPSPTTPQSSPSITGTPGVCNITEHDRSAEIQGRAGIRLNSYPRAEDDLKILGGSSHEIPTVQGLGQGPHVLSSGSECLSD